VEVPVIAFDLSTLKMSLQIYRSDERMNIGEYLQVIVMQSCCILRHTVFNWILLQNEFLADRT